MVSIQYVTLAPKILQYGGHNNARYSNLIRSIWLKLCFATQVQHELLHIPCIAVTHHKGFEAVTMTLAGDVLVDSNVATPQAITDHQVLIWIESCPYFCSYMIIGATYSFYRVFICMGTVLIGGV